MGAEIAKHLGAAGVIRGAKSSQRSGYFDIVEPESIILIGRLLVALASIATVAVAMLLARRLRGRAWR